MYHSHRYVTRGQASSVNRHVRPVIRFDLYRRVPHQILRVHPRELPPDSIALEPRERWLDHRAQVLQRAFLQVTEEAQPDWLNLCAR